MWGNPFAGLFQAFDENSWLWAGIYTSSLFVC